MEHVEWQEKLLLTSEFPQSEKASTSDARAAAQRGGVDLAS